MINKMVRLYAVIFLVSVAWMSYGQSTTAPQEIQVRTDARPVPAQASGPSYLLSTLNVTDLKDVFPACAGGDYYVGFQLSYDLSNNNTELAWAVDLGITLTDGVNNYAMPTLTVRMGDQTFLSTAFYNSAITCNSSYKVRIDTKTLTGTVPQTTVTLKVLLFKKFENVFTPAGTITVNSAYSNGTSTVSWNPHTTSIPATLGYDVEWVYIEQHEGFSGSAAEAFIFKEPVRITTATTSYSHLTYYPTGQIYYRVRAVGFDPQYPDHRLIGNWFYASSPISITNHNSGYTWQLQTIFAEEGKNKKIMGYYDGTLRQRQVLTNISSENVTVVGESAYDYEGRKSIDILPVPVTAVPITWQYLVGVTVSGATLTKPSGTAAWNAGAASVQQIPANASGWLEIPITSITGNRMIGLSDADTDQNCTSIDFGFYLNGNSLRVYENCVSKYVVPGTLVIGDFVQIERIGSTVVYKKNGAIVYTSLTASTSVLIADASINSVGGTLSDISISDSPLRFKPDFNRFQSQSTLVTSKVTGTKRKFHYDNRDTLNSVISNLGGAGKYYSPLTAPPGTLKDYIPDAEGYVFSQTEYLNDGTGRVSKQSGVGQAFRMDDSHVTKNYYGSAAAAELQRLFGTNVGNASHYKKNLVVDPNGQVSVSYLDQEDRVIATALAGEKPANVDGLPSYTALGNDLIEVSLNSKNQKKEGVSVTSHKIMNVAVNTGYTFTYDLSALASEIETVGCVACGFDLTITVTDPNGNALDLSGQPGNESVSDNFVYARNNVTATSCGAPYDINTVELELTFPLIGDYTVTKTLRAKELTFESVLELISQTETVQDLIDEITVSYELDSADCEVCTTCDADDAINEAIEEIAELDCENILQRIIYELQMDSLAVDSLSTYEPSQDDIEAHPGYCEYELCVKNQASDAFEKQLARVADWDAADLLGYDTLINKDPFFNVDTLSGDGYKDEMQALIDDIYLTKVDGNDLRGTLLEVTDPANEDYYVDEEGNGDPDGYHILYIDFMKAGYGPASPEIKEQRWELYKALYLEAKRKIKLTITGYVNCDSAYVKLQMQDGLPTTEEDIAAYGEAQGVGGDVSEEEVASSFYTIRNMCPDAVISESDSLTISSHLEAYFNNHPDNFYRIIILSDLNEDSDLDAIQDILTPLGCGLDSVALVDPITCARDTTIVYSQYSEIQEEGCTSCRQAAPSNAVIDSLQQQQFKKIDAEQKNKMIALVQAREVELRIKIDEAVLQRKKEKIARIKPVQSNKNARKSGPGPTQNLITSDEYSALMELYSSTDGPNWTNKTGWSTANPSVPEDVSGWYGITVNGTGNVTAIDLQSNNLDGTIPPSIGDFPFLQSLILNTNQLSGSIPSDIGDLSALVNLRLIGNQLTGSIPSSIGGLSNLIELYLSYNQLSGSIPASLGNLDDLITLSLESNALTDSIPSSLGGLSSLISLGLHKNDLSGKIPASLGNLSNLVQLALNENELSNSIPPQLGNLSNLVSLTLYDNNLTGSIPSQLGNLENLLYLYLSYNQLSGSIPSSFGDLESLVTMSLENNQLTGSIPTTFGQLSNLEGLALHNNQLNGSIPVELGDLENLKSLNLHVNELSGSIPAALGDLEELQSLSLYANELTDSIPSLLGNLTNLLQLYLSYNQLSGSIPASLGNLVLLHSFSLENNQLTGSIPASLGQLVNLESLSLANNELTGSIPKQLGNLTQLTAINLYNNNLTGSIPSSFVNLHELQSFAVADNYLSGNIPKINPAGLLTAQFGYNKFTFSSFLTFMHSFTGSVFDYMYQDSVDTRKKVYGAIGTTVKLQTNIDKATSPASKYQWFKNGVSLGAPSTTKHTLVIPSVGAGDVATYHYQITNSDANSLTLVSRPQQLVLSDSLISFTYCLEYDSTNETLNKFKFVVDWDAVVQQCMENAAKEDSILISRSVEVLLEEQATLFYNKQSTNCLDSITENFYYAYIPKEYHYTLYYYDQAGNLVQTVPPAGVDTEDQDHKLITRYTYNSINQLVWQKTPDAGESQFWYDDKGQLRLSQNAQQFKDDKYSYTQYDNQGRVVQVGELYTTENISSLKVKLEDPVFPINQGFTLKDVTKTYYDFPKTDIQSTFPQDYLRNRVSWTEVYENLENNTPELLTNGTFTGSLTGWTQTGASPHSWNWDSYLGGIAVVTLDGDVDSKSLGQSISPVTAGEIVTVKAEYVIDYAATPNSIKLLFCTTPGSVVQEIILSSDEAVGSYDKEITVTALANFSYVEVIVHATDESYYLNEISLKRENNVNATYYSYDVHGNVKALLQKIPNLGNKRTDYVYDLVSGKVNYAIYQYGQPDQFIHKYTYDADNRIKDVSTSTDGFLFDKEADYKYYQHGPLARVVLGEYTGVQGLDYYYTLQGWIKGVNMPYAADLSNDGYNPSKVGRDVFAYALGYYTEDYKPRTASKVISGVRDSLWTRYNAMYTSQGYYNGNIAWMETDLKKIGQQKGARVKGMQAMMYRYDQLHRIMQSRSLTNYNAADFKFLARTNPNEAYDEDFNYDPNGNLLTLERRDNTAAVLDNFNYTYYNNTNKLRYLNPVTRDTTYTGDIYGNDKLYDSITVASTANVPDGGNPTLRATSNIDFEAAFDLNDNAAGFRAYIIGDNEGEFNYDAIGNLVWDMGNGVRIAWTPYGKVRHVSKANGDSILYRYDAAGNRIEKRTVTAGIANTTYYVRDAGGNVMGTYHTGAAMNIEWINPVGVTVSGTTVTKPSGSNAWNAGASSLQRLPAGINGYLEFKVTSVTGNRMVGFNDVDADANYTGINYAVYLNGNSLKAYSNGTQVYDAGAASLAVNDVLKLERIGSTVYLRKNGTLAHTFALASGTSLVADMVINTVSSSIEGVTYFFGEVMVTEQPVYGSSRLGVYRGHRQPGIRQLGHKTYELSNHLGNVLATVSDNVRVRTDSAFANVVNSTDYYAFGSEMPTRTYSMNSDYRYGFNGKEQDTENTWGDDIYDYGFRIYNPRIGKFLSVDPLTRSYPWYTPYQFAGNKPIMCVDVDGLEDQVAIDGSTVSGPFNMDKINSEIVRQQVNSAKTVMHQQPLSRSPNVPTIGPDPFKGESAAAYKHMRSNAIHEANLRRLENHLTPYEKAGVFAVDAAFAIEGGYGLAKFTLNVPKYVKNYFSVSKAMSPLAKELTAESSVLVQVAKSADDIGYLKAQGAEAAYFSGEGNSGFMLIREGAARPTILEEVIHHNQKLKYGEQYMTQNVVQIEIEAQNILLEVGKQEKWTAGQMDRIRRAKDVWTNKSKSK